MKKIKNRPNHFLYIILEAAPAAWVVFFVLFVVRAWLQIGYLPRSAHPDPKNLNMDFHHGFLWLSLYVLPWLVLSYGVLNAYKKIQTSLYR